MYSPMFIISMESIKVQEDVVHHPYATEAISQVLALTPKDRLIKIVGIKWNQTNLI